MLYSLLMLFRDISILTSCLVHQMKREEEWIGRKRN